MLHCFVDYCNNNNNNNNNNDNNNNNKIEESRRKQPWMVCQTSYCTFGCCC